MQDSFENKSLTTLVTPCNNSSTTDLENEHPIHHKQTLKSSVHRKELRGSTFCFAYLAAKRDEVAS